MLSAVLLVVVRAMLMVPLPATSGMTSAVVQARALTGPEEPVLVAASAGALLKVILRPLWNRLVSVTPNTWSPMLWAVFEHTQRRARHRAGESAERELEVAAHRRQCGVDLDRGVGAEVARRRRRVDVGVGGRCERRRRAAGGVAEAGDDDFADWFGTASNALTV